MFNLKSLMSVSAELTASAATYYTSTNTKTLITKVTVNNNNTTTIRTVTFYLIKSGGSAGDTTAITVTLSIAPLESRDITALMGHSMEDGDFIQALASSANDVALFMSGIQTGLQPS